MYIVYLILFTVASGLALFLKHYHPSFKWFGFALLFLLFTELTAGYFIRINPETGFPPYLVYHINIPLFLILIYNFFKNFIQEPIIKKVLFVLISANTLLAISLTIFFYKINDFPGIQLNSMGIIMIGMNLYVLLTLEPIARVPIFKHPMAWICLGYIVFFTATFFLNGIYNKLVESSSPYRSFMHLVINRYSNIFLYSCIIIGLLLSNRITRQINS
jgi:hypothetical protein